jgi:hypothetical protein
VTPLLAFLRDVLRRTPTALLALFRALVAPLRRVLEVVLALILLFEEWGWRPLVALVGGLRRFLAWQRLEDWLASLPPYGALAAFVLPSALVLPLKLLSLWLVADGRAVAAGALFIAAKLVGTAFVARIFVLTRPKLMAIPWFAWAYGRIVPWQEALFARIRGSWAWRYGRILKERARRRLRPHLDRLLPWLAEIRWRAVEAWRDARTHLAGLRTRLLARVRAWRGRPQ